MNNLKNSIEILAKSNYNKKIAELTSEQLHTCVSRAVMANISDMVEKSQKSHAEKRRAYYFSAEFLVGRAIYNNLLCTGMTEQTEKVLKAKGKTIADFEEIEDAA